MSSVVSKSPLIFAHLSSNNSQANSGNNISHSTQVRWHEKVRRAITPPKKSPIGQSAGVSPCAAETTHAMMRGRMSDTHTKPAPATTTAVSDDVFSDDVSDEALLAACQKAGEQGLRIDC